eukprot:scaffold87802_cov48-Phaeocystis_antarctica.AAC.1
MWEGGCGGREVEGPLQARDGMRRGRRRGQRVPQKANVQKAKVQKAIYRVRGGSCAPTPVPTGTRTTPPIVVLSRQSEAPCRGTFGYIRGGGRRRLVPRARAADSPGRSAVTAEEFRKVVLMAS